MEHRPSFTPLLIARIALLWSLIMMLSACGEIPSGGTVTTLTKAAAAFEPDVAARAGFDWPQFLGPEQTGISRETGLLEVWPEGGPPLVWQLTIGTGYSAPSVLGNRLVVHHRVGFEEIVECLNASTGETVWKTAYSSRFRDPYGYNNGPRCSPLLTPTHCYTFGAEGRLLCVRLENGEIVWERKTQEEFDIPEGFFGVGCTPILEGDKLIVLVGGQPNSGVVAFDAATGRTLWESVGQKTWDGVATGWPGSAGSYRWQGDEMIVSYSSPIAATIHGRRHILCLMRQGLVSLDPDTGKENFRHWFMARVHESVNAARPVVVEDTILLSAAYRTGSELLRVQPDGQGVDVVWRNANNLETHWSTALYLEGCFYGFSGRHENEGELRCVDAASGKVLWATSGWERVNDLEDDGGDGMIDITTGQKIPWPFYGRGSKILADSRFIVLGERGTLALVEPSREGWREISRCTAPRMSYPSWAAPVLSRGYLYLRDEDSLVCLDLRKTAEPVGRAIVE